jgi:hypothetical protein
MLGATTTSCLRVFLGFLLGGLLAAATGPAMAQSAVDDSVHLGVASCAGSTCHGAVERLKGSSVAQNEYITWSRKDKHAKAYAVLLEDRSQRIAHNLGLPNANTATLCLDCHADNAAPDKRGPQFQISDGVGCEACHGGAKSWLGTHISGAKHPDNLAAGMYPTEQPVARAERCLACHMGDEKRFVTHQIMGAGHPRISFELDTFTAVEPAHFTIDKDYIARKGPVNGVQIWAVGQAVALGKFMDAMLDPKHAPNGVFPELVFFDCTACHHSMSQLRWAPQASTGLPPGTPTLYDANAVMLRIIANQVAPAAGKALSDHILALHRATRESWANVLREAREVRKAATDMLPILSKHDFTRDEMRDLANGLIAMGVNHESVAYPDAEQATMALSSIVSAMKLMGYASEPQAKSMTDALDGVYEALAKDETYRPAAFVTALRDFQKTVPR